MNSSRSIKKKIEAFPSITFLLYCLSLSGTVANIMCTAEQLYFVCQQS